MVSVTGTTGMPDCRARALHLLGHRARGLGVVQQHLRLVPGDQPEHPRGVARARVVAVLDRGGEPRRGHHLEPGGLEQVAGDPLGVGDRRARVPAADRRDHGLDGPQRGVERRQVRGEHRRVTRFEPGQRGLDGGRHPRHPGDVVPEVRVHVGPVRAEHRLDRQRDPARVHGGREQLGHEIVIARPVGDDQPRLGHGQRAGDIGLVQVRVGARAGQDRGDLDMRAADLRRDVPPEILPRDHLHHTGRDRGLRGPAPGQHGRGRQQARDQPACHGSPPPARRRSAHEAVCPPALIARSRPA